MVRHSISQKLLIEEITQLAQKLRTATRGLSIGYLIKHIRMELGMTQKILSNRAGIPQSTVSRIEQQSADANISTLKKILSAMSCDLVIVPLLNHSIESIRRRQARKIAENHIQYLKGTMHLEDQQPDPAFIEELLKSEEERLLQNPKAKLWDE